MQPQPPVHATSEPPLLDHQCTIRPNPEVVGRRLDDSFVLVHLGTNKMMELNPSGARIWELIVEGVNLRAIVAKLNEEFSINSDHSIEDQVMRFVQQLRRENLVQLPDQT